MTSQIRGLIRFSMGVVLMLGLALNTSCGDPAGETQVGELGMTLSTTNGDVVYRLRDALFQIRGPENTDVCTEDHGTIDDEFIFLALRSGDYQVGMDLGGGGGAGGMAGTGGTGGSNCPNWYMEYSAGGRPYEPIDAVLVSVNPVDVRVNTAETTFVYFRFEVDGRLIDFGPGTLGIGIDVTEVPPSGGGTGGAGGEGGMAGSGGMGGMGGTPVSFADDILPYFVSGISACTNCHVGDRSGTNGVRLDSYANIMEGGGTCSATMNQGCNVDADCPGGETCDTFPLVVPDESTNPAAALIPQLEANHHNGTDDAGFVPILSRWIDEGALDN